jgi:hypothetical protein
MMRLVIAAIICMAAASPSAAQSTQPDFGKAYSYALRCFVAGGVAAPKPEDDPDGLTTKSVREYAHKAFDAAYFTGGKLGYSKDRISADLDHAQNVELRLMVQNPNYFAQTKSDCVKLGLMQPNG